MDELMGAISGLPSWAQLLILIAVVTVGAIFGRKTGSQPRQGGSAPSTKSRKPALKGLSAEEEDQPGRFGSGSTRDLTREEISKLHVTYAPQPHDNDPDPGEVVWTWVPFVENDGRGKDRPVLIIARINSSTVAGCYLSTKQHRDFISVGPGPWDSKGRESFLSPERVLSVSHDGMRREGAVMPQKAFSQAMRQATSFLPIDYK